MAKLNEFKSCARLRVLSVATSSSVVVPTVLHSYPLCQQPVCVCVCVCEEGGMEGGDERCNGEQIQEAILMTHLPVCSGEVNATIDHPPTTVFLLYTCAYIHILCSIHLHMYTPKYIHTN